MPVFIEAVESNIKGIGKVKLSPLTLLLGPSESGKTGVLNAIEFVASGGCSDVGIHDWRATASDLWDLAPDGAKYLYGKLTGSDGQVASRTLTRTKGGAFKVTDETLPWQVLLPVAPFRDGLKGKPETVRAFLMERLPPVPDATVEGKLKELMDKADPALYDLAKADMMPTGKMVDRLTSLRSQKTTEANAAQKQVDLLAVQIQQAQELVGLNLLSPEEEATLAAQLSQAQALAPLVLAYPARKAAAEEAGAQVLALNQQLQSALAHTQALMAAKAAMPPDTQVDMARRAVAVLEGALDPTLGTFLSGCITVAWEEAHARLALGKSYLEGLPKGAPTQDAVDAAGASLMGVHSQLQKAQALFYGATQAQEEAENAVMAVGGFDAAAILFDVTQKANQAMAAKVANTKRLELEETKAAQELAVGQAHKIVGAVDGVLEWLLDSSRAAFVATVNKHLPEPTFDLVLEHNGKPACRFGVIKKGTLRTALSGAEIQRVLMAMVAATVPADPKGPIVFLPPRDVDKDAVTLARMMRALSPLAKKGVQVILTSTIKPAGKMPAGWVIENAPGGVATPDAIDADENATGATSSEGTSLADEAVAGEDPIPTPEEVTHAAP